MWPSGRRHRLAKPAFPHGKPQVRILSYPYVPLMVCSIQTFVHVAGQPFSWPSSRAFHGAARIRRHPSVPRPLLPVRRARIRGAHAAPAHPRVLNTGMRSTPKVLYQRLPWNRWTLRHQPSLGVRPRAWLHTEANLLRRSRLHQVVHIHEWVMGQQVVHGMVRPLSPEAQETRLDLIQSQVVGAEPVSRRRGRRNLMVAHPMYPRRRVKRRLRKGTTQQVARLLERKASKAKPWWAG